MPCHAISRLPEIAGDKVAKIIRSATSTSTLPRFALGEGKLYLFMAIDRTSKFVFAQLIP